MNFFRISTLLVCLHLLRCDSKLENAKTSKRIDICRWDDYIQQLDPGYFQELFDPFCSLDKKKANLDKKRRNFFETPNLVPLLDKYPDLVIELIQYGQTTFTFRPEDVEVGCTEKNLMILEKNQMERLVLNGGDLNDLFLFVIYSEPLDEHQQELDVPAAESQ